MLYSTCPTCGYLLAQKIVKYENEKQQICDNPKLKQHEKDEEISKLLLSLKLRRYCCQMRIMTFKDLVVDIVS